LINFFKKKRQYIGIVVDEYGSIKGIITLHDLIEAIVGDLPDEDETEEPHIFKRQDGSYLLEGKTLIYEINQYFQTHIIEDNVSRYTTISGFILSQLNEIPKAGDIVHSGNYQFEVMDIDGVRIDKVLMTPLEV
jgi:putative hemolysin